MRAAQIPQSSDVALEPVSKACVIREKAASKLQTSHPSLLEATRSCGTRASRSDSPRSREPLKQTLLAITFVSRLLVSERAIWGNSIHVREGGFQTSDLAPELA